VFSFKIRGAYNRIAGLSAEQRAAVQDMTTAMVNKMLHGPISQLRKSSPEELEDPTLYVAALKKLFDLEDK